MKDAFGFQPVQRTSEEIIETPVIETENQETITPEVENIEGGSAATPGEGDNVEKKVEEVVVTPPIAEDTETKVPEPVIEYIDPFKDLDDQAKAIFEAIKSKDLSKIKEYIDAVTVDYDNVSDYDVLRSSLKQSHPKWSDDMVELELAEKYGFGIDEDELEPKDKLRFDKNRIADSEQARELLKAKIAEVSFPEIAKQESTSTKEEQPQYSAEELAEFQEVWKGQVETGVEGLTDEIVKIEVGSDGNKAVYEFPIVFTPEDKQGLKSKVSEYDLQNDFNTRYVKDGAIDVKKFARDQFILENAIRLISSSFAQGHTKGRLEMVKEGKNIDFSRSPGDGTSQVDKSTEAAKYFLSNGGRRG